MNKSKSKDSLQDMLKIKLQESSEGTAGKYEKGSASPVGEHVNAEVKILDQQGELDLKRTQALAKESEGGSRGISGLTFNDKDKQKSKLFTLD